MSDSQFDEVKKEIRSVLITYQKGCSYSEFQKEYKSLIGRPLPSKEFNFHDDISFLRSMPDVVAVYNSPVPGDYRLIGIADKYVKHIQKMVCRQKPSKHKLTFRPPKKSFASPFYSQQRSESKVELQRHNSDLPPRFRKPVKETILLKKELPSGVDHHVIRLFQHYYEGLKLSKFLESFRNMYKREFTFKDWGFSTLEECLETIPGLQAVTKNNEIIVYLEENDVQKEVSRFAGNRCGSPFIQSQMPTERNSSQDFFSQSNADSASRDNFLLNRFVEDVHRNNSSSQTVPPKHPLNDHYLVKVPTERNSSQDFPSQSNSNSASRDNFLLNRFVEDVHQNNSSFQTVPPKNPLEDHYLVKDGSIAATSSEKNISHSNYQSKVNTTNDFQLVDLREPQPHNSNTPSLHSYQNFESKDTDKLDSFMLSSYDHHSSVSENVRNNLQLVMEKYPHGIFASEFPTSYEIVTNVKFDLHCLGFNHLADFIDAVPDICVRKPLTGSKKDWLIYPTKSGEKISTMESHPGKGSVLFIECVILNARKILQGCAEGIKLSEFNHIYSVNCNEPLYIRDLGYDNLESFLLGIAERVPLRIISDGDDKIVHLKKFEAVIKSPVPPPQVNMAPLDAKFKDLTLPLNYINSQYFPMYTSSIANPGFFYIQLQGEKYSDALKNLYDEIEDFYNGDHCKAYAIKPKDIRVGTACIALWPSDQHWYRAKIISIVSLEYVQVFYIDYGTTDEIPLNMLRYIKKEYLELPAQAIKSRLKYVKPANKATSWDKKSRQRMLELCEDVSLMGKIEDVKDGAVSLILCDTNGTEDLYINDILAKEGIAEYFDELEHRQPQPSPADAVQDLTNISQQEFLRLLTAISSAAVISAFPDRSENLARLVQNCSLNATFNPGVPLQNSLISQSPVPQLLSTCILPPTTNNIYPNPPYGANYNCPQVTKFSNVSPAETPSPDSAEVFDDDDDESFEQFFQTYSAGKSKEKKRYVKRVKTVDGYVFHVLLYNSKPFVSSGDISVLIWNTKEHFYLFRRLQTQSTELPSITLQEEVHVEFFEQLRRFSVKGIVQNDGNKSSILLYPLETVNKILNLFGHPSAALRAKVVHESTSFNALAPHWQESPDSEVPEEIEEVRSVTDDDKLNRLCLYDLKSMREGIRAKRLKLTKIESDPNSINNCVDEITKLDQLFCKVRDRIHEIEGICSTYS